MRSFELKDIDDTPLRFGKYKGSTPNEVADEDPAYLVWLFDNVKDKMTCTIGLYRSCVDMTDDDDDDEYAGSSIYDFYR